MQGKIIKGLADFYYVHIPDGGVYECKARGLFRKEHIKPLVGDRVRIQVIDSEQKTGNIEEILPRTNELIRPAVANIDQALVVFASVSPPPNLNLLSRFLVMMEWHDIPTLICFNKTDQADSDTIQRLADAFSGSGCKIFWTSVEQGSGLETLKKELLGKTTALAGPSGVGKSSILNALFPQAESKTGAISEKINRGKHTTRHTEIFCLGEDSYIVDTPGFTSLDYAKIEADDLHYYFNEFAPYEGQCKFNGCTHVHEPMCRVRQALEEGAINSSRYEIYLEMYREMKEMRKYT